MKPIPSILATALALAPAALASGVALAQSGPFLEREGPDLWRASRLVGVEVLGPDGRRVGAVSDVLVDHDGRAADVVIGVGGFLGIGQKDVALPYAQVRFTGEPRPGGTPSEAATAQQRGGLAGDGAMDGAKASAGAPDSAAGMPTEPGMAAGSAVPVETPSAQSTPPAAALGGPVGTTAGVAGGQVTGLASTPAGPPGGTAAPARSTARPDHATVDLTAAELKAAPSFEFAR